MPLLKIEEISPEVSLGIWEIKEDIEELKGMSSHREDIISEIEYLHNPSRKKETLAVYSLLYLMTGNNLATIAHDEYGRPVIDDYCIGISHTKGYAAIILSRNGHVSVDIEYQSDRVDKIARKFIRVDEDAPTTQHKLINWCAKEACYKYFYNSRLEYYDMRVSFPCNPSPDSVKVENLRDDKTVQVYCQITSGYVLTYIY